MPVGQKQSSSAAAPFLGRRLVFFGAAEDQTEPALLELFSAYGEVAGLFVVRSALGLSSGCGYVTMASEEQARAALEGLQGSEKYADAGGTLGLVLVEAGPAAPGAEPAGGAGTPRGAATPQPSNKNSRSVFFTKVPPVVTAHQLIQLFTACGEVLHLELFTPWPGAKISKGCGLVEFARGDAAAAAVHSLHHKFTWPHSHSALVVEWVDASRQAGAARGGKPKAAASGGHAGPTMLLPFGGGDAGLAAAGAAQHMRRVITLPLDQQQLGYMAGGGYAGQAGVLPHGAHHVQLQPCLPGGSRSCPLPQLPPGWQVLGTAAQMPPGVAGGMLPQPALGYRPQQAVLGGYHQQQPQHAAPGGGFDSGGHFWVPCTSGFSSLAPSVEPSLTSSPAGPDTSTSTSLAGLTMSSNLSSVSTNALLPPGMSQQAGVCDLAGGSSSSALPTVSEPSLAAAMGAGGPADPMWQQLLQQNVMLLQPMSNMLDDVPASSGLPAFSAPLPQAAFTHVAGGQQPQVLVGGLQPQQQQQQPGQPGAQRWWPGHDGQQGRTAAAAAAAGGAGDAPALAVMQLSQRQLQAMSGVLPEVTRLSGAQACLGAGAAGAVQLLLNGSCASLQGAQAVVAMLLAKAGVEEPVVPAMLTPCMQ